jgi:hypothetical protein
MMPLIISKKIKQTILASALILLVPMVQAWVDPVDMDTDHSSTVTTPLGDIDRCDTGIGGYATVPTQCHRRNLVWELGSKDVGGVAEPMAQWNPANKGTPIIFDTF